MGGASFVIELSDRGGAELLRAEGVSVVTLVAFGGN